MLNVEVPDRRRGKSQRKLMDVMKEEMQRVSGTEEGARDRVRWRQLICVISVAFLWI